MNEKLKQFPLLIQPDLLTRVEDFRWANRYKSVADTMRHLLEYALNDLENKGKKKAKHP